MKKQKRKIHTYSTLNWFHFRNHLVNKGQVESITDDPYFGFLSFRTTGGVTYSAKSKEEEQQIFEAFGFNEKY